MKQTRYTPFFFFFLPKTRHTHILAVARVQAHKKRFRVHWPHIIDSKSQEIARARNLFVSACFFFFRCLNHHTLMMHEHLLVHLSSKQDDSESQIRAKRTSENTKCVRQSALEIQEICALGEETHEKGRVISSRPKPGQFSAVETRQKETN